MAKRKSDEEIGDTVEAVEAEDEGWAGGPDDDDFSDAEVPEIGSNVTDDTIRSFARKLMAIEEEAEAIRVRKKVIRKDAKDAGVKLARLDKMMKLMDMTPQEQREHFAEERRYAGALRIAHFPVGAQIDMLTQATDTEVSSQDAYDRGFQAAVSGKGVFGVPPDDIHPMFHSNWLEGWGAGQVKNAPGQLDS